MIYATVAGANDAARRNARNKHAVLFNLAADHGALLKAAFPDIGWLPDQEGHPCLPFSVAARLCLSVCL